MRLTLCGLAIRKLILFKKNIEKIKKGEEKTPRKGKSYYENKSSDNKEVN